MDNMVRVIFAFLIGLFAWELAFLEMVDEPIIWHDMRGVKRTPYGLSFQITH